MWKYLIISLLFCAVNANFPVEIRSDLDEECQQQVNEFKKSFLTKTWPIKMLDSWSKWPSGILEGNIRDAGNFDECININEVYENGRILGKHCNMGMVAKLGEVPLLLSICVPDKCNPSTLFVSSDALSFNDLVCQTQESHDNWNWDDWTVLGVCCFIGVLMVVSTIFDIYLHLNELKPPHPVAIAFSVLTNGKKILVTTNSPDQLHCLNGIRVISMLWVIAGHKWVTMMAVPMDNLLEVQDWTVTGYSMYIQGAPVSVDTFFFLSAFLASYMYFKNMKQGKKVLDLAGIPTYYFHRLFRITPALAALYFISITILPKLSSGPAWPLIFDTARPVCLKYWWSFWLYIQNYYNYDDMCLVPTWYLSADMQMFLISPFIVLPLGYMKRNYAKKKAAYMTAFGVVLLAIIIPFIVNFWREHYNEYETHGRLSVYFIGILMGMFVVDIRDKKNEINKLLNVIIWIVTLVGMFVIVYYTYDDRNFPDMDKRNYFHTFSRPCWALGLCWIVYTCITGNGGIVNWFLSRPIFQIVGRLCYSMYLTHSSVIMTMVGYTRNTIHFADYTIIYLWCGDFIFTMIVSVIWVLAFESPMIGIEKLIFGGGNRPPRPVKKSDDDVAVKTIDPVEEIVVAIPDTNLDAIEDCKPTAPPAYTVSETY